MTGKKLFPLLILCMMLTVCTPPITQAKATVEYSVPTYSYTGTYYVYTCTNVTFTIGDEAAMRPNVDAVKTSHNRLTMSGVELRVNDMLILVVVGRGMSPFFASTNTIGAVLVWNMTLQKMSGRPVNVVVFQPSDDEALGLRVDHGVVYAQHGGGEIAVGHVADKSFYVFKSFGLEEIRRRT